MAEGTKVLSKEEFQCLNEWIRAKFGTQRNFYEKVCGCQCAPTREAAEQAHRRIKQEKHGLSDRLRKCYATLLEISDPYAEFDCLLTQIPATASSGGASEVRQLDTAILLP